MKSRALVIALVALAIAALIAYIASNTRWEDVTLPAPLRGEAATNPFYAAQKLAEALGATTERREALGALAEDVDVLVLTRWHWDLIDARREQIESWVDAGGRLLVDDSLIGGDDFWKWSGVGWEFRLDDADEAEEADTERSDESVTTPAEMTDSQIETCGTFEEVDAAGSVIPDGRRLFVCNIDAWSHLSVDRSIAWGYAHEGKLQAARVELGDGSVTAVNAAPFGNRELTSADHAQLFVAATSLRKGDHIVFISEHKRTSLLALIWQHGAPVVMLALALLAALLWRGGVRFGPLAAPTDTARRSLAEQIRGTGRFAIRLGGGKALHAATLRALQEAARKRIARYDSLADDERLAAIALRAGVEHEALAAAIGRRDIRRTAELAHTISLLETARRRLLD